jgi:hypothetical protein
MPQPLVMKTVEEDGTARITVSHDGFDYRFNVAANTNHVSIEHEESQCGRGRIETSEPPDEIYDILLESAEFREFVRKIFIP